MAENKNILFYLLNALTLFGCVELHAGIKTVAEIYTAEVGVRERTGVNDGVRVEMYLRAANLGRGNPWCAAFVTWAFKEAKVPAVVSGYSPAWFPKKNVVYQNRKGTPRRADVFGIYFPSKGRIAHVGFIDDWGDGTHCVTVEGNTNEAGSREGDGVYKKRRLKNQIYKVSRWTN